MTFHEIIERVNGRKRTLSLYNLDVPPGTLDPVVNYFEPQQVRIRRRETETGHPTNFAVLHDGPEFIAAADLRDLHGWVSLDSGLHTRSFADIEYPDILEHVDDTTFTEFGKRRMILASREIEKAAYRGEVGELHTGFQRLALLQSQRSIYTRLGESDLDVHVYGLPDWEPPEEMGVIAHGIDTAEIAESWFVVYDGGGDETKACALLAEEVGENVYSGFWTYDADLVGEIYRHLTDTYR
ncbi:MAG: DICT sensory domain-containing protein [Haloarculaceae archaeon]